MSRIHDALKRAEQERATSTGTHVETAFEQPGNEARESMPSMHTPAAIAMPAMTTMTMNSAFNYESLMARCPQKEWSPDPRTMLFFQADDSRTGAEEFRTLRSRLYQIREKMPLKRLLVTSALPKEGKSFVAANLAQVLVRQHGRRVLLIDADLRSPGMHRHLGAPQSPGLSDYLLGECDEFAALQRGPMENLFFLPAGKNASSAPELLANGRLKLFLQRVEPLFDWVIMDTSPVIPVSDATLVAGSCDGILMVVRSNATPADLARRAREEFPDKLLLGVVLNGAPADKHQHSKYYYGETVGSPA
ncbi:MAG TPA: CpsD/CapB family tyrosine-protein kinase [Terriglobales bacterium]|jgi:protein-tyrosine kinase|nr:CpsD/CapB family tyrosine-protein kinase [Terriglobales bacterium]